MPLIPPDIGIRLKLPSDTLLPVARTAEIPADLPDLNRGQRFTAQIQEVLPDNSYRALVAGKSLTLSLAESVKTGDMLELVVVDKTPRTIVARTAEPAAAAGEPQPYQYSQLSRAAQLIASLLTPEGESAPPAALNKGRPLLDAPPQTAAQLAPALSDSVAKSGVFYEAHQAQWVAGKFPLAELLKEPQAEHAPQKAEQPMAQVEQPKPQAERSLPTIAVPEELKGLVQQQLDAASTQRLVWHGEVWPGQTIDWQITRERQQRTADVDTVEHWSTKLRLTTPRLGEVEASLKLSQQGVSITLTTPYDNSATDLSDAGPALGQALGAAGVPLLALKVTHESD